METLDKYTEKKETIGKLFICKSKRFGIALLLSIRANEGNWRSQHKFVQLPHSSVLDWESVKDDEILYSWNTIGSMKEAINKLNELKEVEE